jgi:squalene synthase HpnC
LACEATETLIMRAMPNEADQPRTNAPTPSRSGQTTPPAFPPSAPFGAAINIKPTIQSPDVAGSSPTSASAAVVVDPNSLRGAYAFVTQYARKHTENFTVFSLLVRRSLRKDFAAVYAFCRAADDLADDNARTPLERERALLRLRRMRELLHQALGTATPTPEDGAPTTSTPHAAHIDGALLPGLDTRLHIAVAHTIRTKRLSASLFDSLLDAFEHDQRVTRAASWNQLLEYSKGSANPVGRLVLQLHGLCLEGDASPNAGLMQRESDAICTALQLTNFWQDVRRDLLERDRIYIPLADAGVTAEQLASWVDRPNEPPIRRRMSDEVLGLCQRTRRLYEEGAALPTRIANRRLAWMVWLFAKGGEHTLQAVEEGKGITLWQRPTLSTLRRTSLMLRATLGWLCGSSPH